MLDIEIKRIYEPYAASDGYRVLVDKLWPRGISREKAHLDDWAKELAPSTAIRQAFNHEDDKWPAFKKSYLAELKVNPAVDVFLEVIRRRKKTTLLFSAKNPAHNQAVVLRDYLKKRGA